MQLHNFFFQCANSDFHVIKIPFHCYFFLNGIVVYCVYWSTASNKNILFQLNKKENVFFPIFSRNKTIQKHKNKIILEKEMKQQ